MESVEFRGTQGRRRMQYRTMPDRWPCDFGDTRITPPFFATIFRHANCVATDVLLVVFQPDARVLCLVTRVGGSFVLLFSYFVTQRIFSTDKNLFCPSRVIVRHANPWVDV